MCAGRREFGDCSMPSLRREAIDGPVFRYFQQVGLDVEATRDQLAEARGAKLAEVRALRVQAEGEARRAEERLARVRCDYTDGRLDAEDWREFRDEHGGMLEGARAEAAQLREQKQEVESWGELRDAEAETLRKLSAIRSTIAGDVSDAEGIGDVRVALMRLFKRLVVHRGMPERARVELIDADFWIEPIVREEAIEGYGENLRPIVRRESLGQAENNGQPAKAT